MVGGPAPSRPSTDRARHRRGGTARRGVESLVARRDLRLVATYAELHAHSGFSFLDGASDPEELAAEATRLQLSGLALTDHHGLYGVVRFAEAARAFGLATIFGSELTLDGADDRVGVRDPSGEHLVVLARSPEGYRHLAVTLGEAHLRRGEKGAPWSHSSTARFSRPKARISRSSSR